MSNPKQIAADKMEEFAGVVEERSGMKGIFSFIDGTVRPTCKPEIVSSCGIQRERQDARVEVSGCITPDGIMRACLRSCMRLPP